jgi:hypothetical protein
MSAMSASRQPFPASIRWILLVLFITVLLLAGCGERGEDALETPAAQPDAESGVPVPTFIPRPEGPVVDLVLHEEEVLVGPEPLRAGFPFTVTAQIHNNLTIPAEDVPVMVLITAQQEEIGYTSYAELITVTVPASQSLQVDLPVDWNFSGGEHRLWLQVNRLPDAWQERAPTKAETNTRNNIALIDLMVDPFDAYASDLCSGRVDVTLGPEDVLPDLDQQRVLVRMQNVGNRAVYNLPVVVTSDTATGIAYTPAIPPCGGTTEVYVRLDQPLQEGDLLTVQVNPSQWIGGVQEDNFDNNTVSVTADLTTGLARPPELGLKDYDFGISTADIEIPEPWHVLVTVHNLGTRDAAMVPISIENEAGRKLTDAIPLVQGEGIGIAAIRVGYLWVPGGTLTFTVNPVDAKDPFPETRRDNNTTTFTLP